MLFIVEGSRNTGKTYMTKAAAELTDGVTTKIPFTNYFYEYFFRGTDSEFNETNGDMQVWHHTTGYDISTLTMYQDGCMRQDMPIFMDRGFLSNIVLAVAGGRITESIGDEYLEYLFNNKMLDNVAVLIVHSDKDKGRTNSAEQSKDKWHILNRDRTDELFKRYKLILEAKGVIVHELWNDFDEKSIVDMAKIVKDLQSAASN